MHMSVMHSYIHGFIIFSLRRAKGAARNAKHPGNCFTPRSVLREFF